MGVTLKLSDLKGLSQDEQEKLISNFLVEGPLYAKENERRIALEVEAYEEKYAMTTERLHEKLVSGDIEETAEIAKWLFKAQSLKGRNV